MKSEIFVESEPGKGSVFSFPLTLLIGKKHQPEPRINKEINKQTLRGVRVLVVEDNRINQMVARRFLDEWGCKTDIAENGKIALEMLQNKDYDIILMDLQMPVMDGYNATRTIRSMKDPKYQNIPIIALSASALGELETRAAKMGMNGFVVKPFEPAHLFTVIDKFTNA